MKDLPKVEIFTDGSYRRENKKGGYSAIMRCGNHHKIIYDTVDHKRVTINKMEMQAVITALEELTTKCDVKIIADSKYVVDGTNIYMDIWKKRDWKTSQNNDVKNKTYWKKIDSLKRKHDISIEWVRSHTGNKDHKSIGNDVADFFAQEASK